MKMTSKILMMKLTYFILVLCVLYTTVDFSLVQSKDFKKVNDRDSNNVLLKVESKTFDDSLYPRSLKLKYNIKRFYRKDKKRRNSVYDCENNYNVKIGKNKNYAKLDESKLMLKPHCIKKGKKTTTHKNKSTRRYTISSESNPKATKPSDRGQSSTHSHVSSGSQKETTIKNNISDKYTTVGESNTKETKQSERGHSSTPSHVSSENQEETTIRNNISDEYTSVGETNTKETKPSETEISSTPSYVSSENQEETTIRNNISDEYTSVGEGNTKETKPSERGQSLTPSNVSNRSQEETTIGNNGYNGYTTVSDSNTNATQSRETTQKSTRNYTSRKTEKPISHRHKDYTKQTKSPNKHESYLYSQKNFELFHIAAKNILKKYISNRKAPDSKTFVDYDRVRDHTLAVRLSKILEILKFNCSSGKNDEQCQAKKDIEKALKYAKTLYLNKRSMNQWII